MSYSVYRPTRSYLLRLWAQPESDAWIWRVSLTSIDQSAATAQGFDSLDAAVAFLTDQMREMIAVNSEQRISEQ